MKAKLILENGMIFEGNAFGYLKESIGEVVFTTGMMGYQEVLTDPSYYGQVVTMTYPLVGNYGINFEDMESKSPKVKGFIVREKCDYPNNFRCEMNLEDYLKQNKVIGLEGIDTRALTKVLRNSGTMKGIISLEDTASVEEKLNSFSNKEAASKVSTKEKYIVEGNGKHIAIIDFGIKESTMQNFKDRNCKLTVFPMNASSEEILGINPDLVFLSSGPGNPEDLNDVIKTVKEISKNKPVIGMGLGHQVLALAFGGKTKKLKFGHRGANYPVKDLEENRAYITSQNHGYVVETIPEGFVMTHKNINDGTIEGMKHKSLPIFSVQFISEATSGATDRENIFDKFIKYAL